MHDAVLTAPAFAPLDAVAAFGPIVLRPEAEVERRDEEYPVEGRACTGVGGVIGLRWAEMQGVGVPGPRCITILDQAVTNLYGRLKTVPARK
jgi:hypothetical protein